MLICNSVCAHARCSQVCDQKKRGWGSTATEDLTREHAIAKKNSESEKTISEKSVKESGDLDTRDDHSQFCFGT